MVVGNLSINDIGKSRIYNEDVVIDYNIYPVLFPASGA